MERQEAKTMSQCMKDDGTSSSQSAAAEFDVAQRGACLFSCSLCSALVFFFFLAQHTVYGMDSNLNSGAARASQKNAACASWPFAARDGGQTPTLITGLAQTLCQQSSFAIEFLKLMDGLIYGLRPRFARRPPWNANEPLMSAARRLSV